MIIELKTMPESMLNRLIVANSLQKYLRKIYYIRDRGLSIWDSQIILDVSGTVPSLCLA
jgi:hypothetical protein